MSGWISVGILGKVYQKKKKKSLEKFPRKYLEGFLNKSLKDFINEFFEKLLKNVFKHFWKNPWTCSWNNPWRNSKAIHAKFLNICFCEIFRRKYKPIAEKNLRSFIYEIREGILREVSGETFWETYNSGEVFEIILRRFSEWICELWLKIPEFK